MSAPAPRAILSGVQLLRGVAASMVVLSHTNTTMRHPQYFGRSPFGLWLTGEFGVAMFFVISGFIIAYVSLDRRFAPRLAVGDFAWRRAVRILPFMWLCVLGYNLLAYAGTRQVEWAAMLRALVLWPVGELKPNVLWSLRHEWIFYLLFALALLGGRRRWWLLGAWFAGPFLAALVQAAVPGAFAHDGGWGELGRVLLMGGEDGANLQFAAGFLLGLLKLRDAPALAPRLPGGLYAMLAVVILSTVAVETVIIPNPLLRAILWTLPCALVMWLALVARPSNDWLAKAGVVLGDASFSIYLVHNPVLLVQFALARRLAGGVPLELLYPVFVIVAVAAGIAVHYLVEARLIRALSQGVRTAPWLTRGRRRFERS